MYRGHLPVNGDCSQGEAAGIHGEVDQEMHSLAGKGPKEPPIQGVNGGLEGDTANDETEVCHSQVEDEEIGGVVLHLAVPQQHSQHQSVPHSAQKKDEGEDDRHDDPCSWQFRAVRGGIPAPWHLSLSNSGTLCIERETVQIHIPTTVSSDLPALLEDLLLHRLASPALLLHTVCC